MMQFDSKIRWFNSFDEIICTRKALPRFMPNQVILMAKYAEHYPQLP